MHHAGPVPQGVPPDQRPAGMCVMRGQYRAKEQLAEREEMGCGLYLLVFANLHKRLWEAGTSV